MSGASIYQSMEALTLLYAPNTPCSISAVAKQHKGASHSSPSPTTPFPGVIFESLDLAFLSCLLYRGIYARMKPEIWWYFIES